MVETGHGHVTDLRHELDRVRDALDRTDAVLAVTDDTLVKAESAIESTRKATPFLLVGLGIAVVGVTGWLWLDAVVAIAVALNILKEGVHLIWRSSQGLMDEAVEPEVIAQINETLAGFAHQRDEVSIIRFDHITTRKAGQRRFVDMHMHMPASWTLGRAAALRTSVEQALMSAVPGLRASIQLLPSDVEAHFDSERDLL